MEASERDEVEAAVRAGSGALAVVGGPEARALAAEAARDGDGVVVDVRVPAGRIPVLDALEARAR